MVEIDEKTEEKIKRVLKEGEDVDDFVYNVIYKEIEKRETKETMEDRLPETTYVPMDIEEYVGRLRYELEMERSRNRRLSEQVSILNHELKNLRAAYETQRNLLNLSDATLSTTLENMNRFAKRVALMAADHLENQTTIESAERSSRQYERIVEELTNKLREQLSMDEIEKIAHTMMNIFEQYHHLEKIKKNGEGEKGA
ncbi:MAG TPA: hypothetical protein ENF49_00275 [Candidatus Altiarchaeales archaeon]|nr:hypothetical protein [Candidatus Altiarchaeales archaeon]HEX54554.1 hypothetical protein [Candidatus Altiarchaeales archaeon]